ncbi:MAG TPA: YkgJ family cysteine cluster protein [Candidatus Competibacter sp.]|nr:YkgJ family cysteine cluster protein [Candidatus Competibacter sp.]
MPISEIETRRLAEVVGDMPEPRKSKILARFEEARMRLQEAGLLEKLRRPNSVRDEEVDPLGLEYFRQGIACPFLEEESCSIYAERPLACREYLVVTPAENCAKPTVDSIESVKLVARVAKTVRGLDAERSREGARWVPLILALEWAETHPDETLQSLGTDLVRDVFDRLMRRNAAAAKEGGGSGS